MIPFWKATTSRTTNTQSQWWFFLWPIRYLKRRAIWPWKSSNRAGELDKVPEKVGITYSCLTHIRWLGFLVIAFGAFCTGIGFTHNFAGLAALRFLLGAAEAGAFPGMYYFHYTLLDIYRTVRLPSPFLHRNPITLTSPRHDLLLHILVQARRTCQSNCSIHVQCHTVGCLWRVWILSQLQDVPNA